MRREISAATPSVIEELRAKHKRSAELAIRKQPLGNAVAEQDDAASMDLGSDQ